MLANNVADPSPFHAGERQVQERLGVRDEIEAFARRAVRDYMLEQHRDFYAQLPLVFLGTIDDRGRPWASMVTGKPGFMSTPDARTLDIAARPLVGDPLNDTLKADADIGLLGLEFQTRRRNRLTGHILAVRPDGFRIAARQSFGNCPQYIQTRLVDHSEAATGTNNTVVRSESFDEPARRIIEHADTFFIATAYSDKDQSAANGADVSHRGGRPGFVRIENDRSFIFPDFSGNNHFNTIGNLLLNPRAGFLFVDFDTGERIYMTGETEIVWHGDEVRAFDGAERLVRFRADEVVRVEGGLPFRFRFGSFSPSLDMTGDWAKAAATIGTGRARDTYVPFEVTCVRKESDEITSLHLKRSDGQPVTDFEPGQFLPIRVALDGEERPELRTYTISNAPGGDHYRLSVKRELPDGRVSNFLHDHANAGIRLEAIAPRGKFVLDRTSPRPVVLLSAGVGITPTISMINALVGENHSARPIYFIHGARNGRALAFGAHIRELEAAHVNVTAHIRFSQPEGRDRLGKTHDSEGRIDIDLLKRLLPFDAYDFYLCGPQPFMQSIYEGLTGLGVSEQRIHYESFGPATVLNRTSKPDLKGRTTEPVKVTFARSKIEAEWTPQSGTLLDLAEQSGLSPSFSCRSGICGTCTTDLKCGAVDYLDEPSAATGDGEVLICSAIPRASSTASCGAYQGLVLDL